MFKKMMSLSSVVRVFLLVMLLMFLFMYPFTGGAVERRPYTKMMQKMRISDQHPYKIKDRRRQ